MACPFRVCSIIVFISILRVVILYLQDDDHSRRLQGKRDLWGLCDLIQFYTENSCMRYNHYGCFCGLGQLDSQPVDEIDACCREHDICYGNVSCLWRPQFVSFGKKCNSTTQMCHCTDSPGTCSRQLCECDKTFAACLQGKPLQDEYRYYNRSQCGHYNITKN